VEEQLLRQKMKKAYQCATHCFRYSKRAVPLFFAAVLLWAGTLPAAAQSQDIVTAEQFFDAVSEQYGTIEDYIANITSAHGETSMQGTVYYKAPNLLRINFSEPEDQVLVVNDEQLMLHLPKHHVVMRQVLEPGSSSSSSTSLAGMASEKGLQLLKRSYSVAFLEGPEPMPLEEGADIMVRKLKLAWRTPGEGFRQIEVSVNKDMMIRRMVGITGNYERFQFDFTNIRINQDIPDSRFDFEEPPSAYRIDNFLFDPKSQ
jgi:outer membrane lipoprotein-sorting protein